MSRFYKKIIESKLARIPCVWIFGCFAALAVDSANAQTIHNASNATELEAALTAAASGDEILITGTITPSEQIVVSKAVTIKSSAPGSYRTINGAGVTGEPVFKVTAAATLEYLTFQNATSGAVEARNGNFIHCKFLSNNVGSGNGGAFSVPSGTVSVDWSTFSGNTARDKGGAIYNKGNLTVNHSKFTGNSVTIYFGGAISNSGTLKLYNSELNSGNSAPGGGAIYSDGTMTVLNSNVENNTASNGAVGGGGIYADSAYNLQNSIVRSNSPDQLAGSVPTKITCNIQGDPDHSPVTNVDAGTSSYWLNKVAYPLHANNENLKRIQNGVVDIGAYESGNQQWSNFNLAWTITPEDSATFGGTNHTDGSYAETTSITLSPVAATGKQFKQWTGAPFPVGKNPLTRILSFKIDQSYTNLVAEFEDVTYSVNLNAPLTLAKIAGVWYDISSIQKGGNPLINEGLFDESNETASGNYPEVAVISAHPESGFFLKDWWIRNDDGLDVNASATAEFNATSPLTLTYEKNWTVTPIFGEAVYSIHLVGTPGAGSSSLFVIPPADGEFNVDENVTIEWDIADGYQLDTITFTTLAGQEVNASDLLGLSVYENGLNEELGRFRFTLGGDIAVDLNVTAYFEPKSYSISFTEQYDGIQSGEVILQPPMIVPGTGEKLISGKYTEGTQLNLFARPLTGIDPNKFEVEWKYGRDSSTQNPHSLFMHEDLAVIVTYRIKQYKLTQKIIFGDENATYVELVSMHGWGDDVNSTVQYNAAGFDFNGSSYADGNAAPNSFTMTEDVTIRSLFVRKVHAVTTIAMKADGSGNLTAGGGSIVVKPDLFEFEHGQQIELQAIADSAYQFDHWEWSGLANYTPSLSLTVNEPLSVTAVFVARIYRYEFRLDPISGGSFFANNANFGDRESATFTHGDNMEIQVVPIAGYDVTGSISMVDSNGNPLSYQTVSGNDKKITLIVDSNATISASFTEDYKDTDGDGLDNYTESLHGSDPFLKDSDGDAMDDLWEVTHLLNPIDALDAGYDPDYDKVTNLQEYQSGTFPKNPDSDGDGYVDVYNPTDSSTLAQGYSFLTVQVIPQGAGIARGEGAHKDDTSVPITITQENPGFVFISWEGPGFSTTDQNTTIVMDASKTVTANFSKDYRDTDGDGLDNYTEGILGTDTNKTDTDGDGIDDGVEKDAQGKIASYKVTGIFDPTKSDQNFFDYLATLNLATPSSGSAVSGSSSGTLLDDFINGWFYTSGYGWSFATTQSPSIYSSQISTWLNFQLDASNNLKLLKWDYANKQWVAYDYASSLTAAANHFTLTVTQNQSGGGEVSPSSTYPAGTSVTIQALPAQGYHFVGWEGDRVSTTAKATFVLDKNISVKAIFLSNSEVTSILDGTPGN
jgi:predicted outer membrane repeat protein